MAQIIYYLKSEKPDKKGKRSLIAQISLEYKNIRKYLGKVREKEWNKKKQRLSLPAYLSEQERNENLSTNILLDEIDKRFNEFINKNLLEKHNPTEDEIKNLLCISTENDLHKSANFYAVFEDFINSNKSDKAHRTIMGYTTTLNYFKTFEEKTGYKITWDSLNLTFFDSLKTYHYDVIVKQTSYFAKVQRVLKTFLKWAEKRDYYSGKLYNEFNDQEPEKEVIYLTLDELFDLNSFKFSQDRLKKTRDLFCFSCFTGLRYSDVISLKREHIIPGYYCKVQKKTSELIKNPINDFAQAILDKYSDLENPLPQMSTQKLNDYIKECCREVAKMHNKDEGFNKILIKRNIIGSKVTEKKVSKYNSITFHTARKTFITNSMAMGMNIKVIQEMGAPKRDKDLRKYLKVSDDLKSKAMDQTWNSIK
jgi:integrase